MFNDTDDGQTQYCPMCEEWAEKYEKLKAENEELKRKNIILELITEPQRQEIEKYQDKALKYKQALEKIRECATTEMVEIATRADYNGFLALKGISAKINKVLKDE